MYVCVDEGGVGGGGGDRLFFDASYVSTFKFTDYRYVVISEGKGIRRGDKGWLKSLEDNGAVCKKRRS